jgi:hypothetical protein
MHNSAWLFPVVAALFGAVIGSFLNVVIHRLPAGESVVSPGSRCPRCGAPIRARDNVPVLGSARAAPAEPIAVRYLLVSWRIALWAALALRFASASRSSGPPSAPRLVITLIDLDHTIILTRSPAGHGHRACLSFMPSRRARPRTAPPRLRLDRLPGRSARSPSGTPCAVIGGASSTRSRRSASCCSSAGMGGGDIKPPR